MDELVQWLREQLDEDERIARGTGQPSTSWQNVDMDGELRDNLNAGTVAYVPREETRAHIARHDPARVLREIDAKRRLIGRINTHATIMGWDEIHGDLLRSLALPYADRPGYREEWRP